MYKIRDIIVYFSYKYHGNWEQILQALKNKEIAQEEDIKNALKKVGENYITIVDEDYPNVLKEIYRPPFVLYYKGDISLLNKESKYIAFVGSRENTSYGEKATRKIISDLAGEDVIIVSGLAKGIDGIAHQSALENGIKTIGILGTGINVCYPKENVYLYDRMAKEGLILSEYPLSLCESDSFPKRNRLIAGLCSSIVVCEAKSRSGTQITVNYALEQGKDIYAIPNSIFEDSFCNHLLKEGANIILDGRELIEKN